MPVSKKLLSICPEGQQFYKSSSCPVCPVCERERKPGSIPKLRQVLKTKGLIFKPIKNNL